MALTAIEDNNYDPLGELFTSIESSPFIIKCNIPNEISLQICSYLQYYETTLNAVEVPSTVTYSPGPEGKELCILITTPQKTSLPSNAYILSDVIFPFKGPIEQREYYAAIQLFDKNVINNQPPGEGKIIYKSDKLDTSNMHKINVYDNNEKEEKMCKLSSIDIELKCGTSYLFYIEELGFTNIFQGITIRLGEPNDNSIMEKLKFCSTIFWYPPNKYQKPSRYINYFQLHFRAKSST